MYRRSIHLLFCFTTLALALALTACVRRETQATSPGSSSATIQITSPVFEEGFPLPARYTCDGEDVSPPLRWSSVPKGTQSIALICNDPDAPLHAWTHWVLYNISPTVVELAEGVPTAEIVLNGTRQGVNDFKRVGYGGPCPPSGNPHHYFFALYALDAELQLKPGATAQDLTSAMAGHILAEGRLMGTYKRK